MADTLKAEKAERQANSYNLNKELPPKRGERLISQAEAIAICNFDDEALSIISESDFTTHNRQGDHRAVRAANILNDFFDKEHFEGKTILEFGPGHYSFAMLARSLGARVICVERHPVHVRLGRHLGFEVLDMNFEELKPEQFDIPLDGLWIKGAFNACRFKDESEIQAFVDLFTGLIQPEGWGWCVTVNKGAHIEDEQAREAFELARVESQRKAFERCGWLATPIDEADRKRYALKYAASLYYFTRNLTPLSV